MTRTPTRHNGMDILQENQAMRRLLGMPHASNVEILKDAVSVVTGLQWDEISSKGKAGLLPLARGLFAYVGVMRHGMHPSEISRELLRDRTTIYHSVESIGDKLHIKSPLETGMYKQINTILDNVYNRQ